jgi:hypothetical protein
MAYFEARWIRRPAGSHLGPFGRNRIFRTNRGDCSRLACLLEWAENADRGSAESARAAEKFRSGGTRVADQVGLGVAAAALVPVEDPGGPVLQVAGMARHGRAARVAASKWSASKSWRSSTATMSRNWLIRAAIRTRARPADGG